MPVTLPHRVGKTGILAAVGKKSDQVHVTCSLYDLLHRVMAVDGFIIMVVFGVVDLALQRPGKDPRVKARVAHVIFSA